MTLSYADSLLNPASRKEVFTVFTFRAHTYAWETSGTGGVWVLTFTAVTVENMNENDVAMGEESSLGNLASADTSTVGSFFWDAGTEQLYVKPKTSSEPFDNFYIAFVDKKFNRDGQLLSGVPYEARISNIPAQTLKSSDVFDGTVVQRGTGNIGLHNADALMNRRDIEPDGDVTITARNKTFGGQV